MPFIFGNLPALNGILKIFAELAGSLSGDFMVYVFFIPYLVPKRS